MSLRQQREIDELKNSLRELEKRLTKLETQKRVKKNAKSV